MNNLQYDNLEETKAILNRLDRMFKCKGMAKCVKKVITEAIEQNKMPVFESLVPDGIIICKCETGGVSKTCIYNTYYIEKILKESGIKQSISCLIG